MRQVHGFLPVCPCPASLSVSVTAAAGHPVAQAQIEDPPLPAPLQSHCPLLWQVQSVPDRNDSRSSATAPAGAWPPLPSLPASTASYTAGQGPLTVCLRAAPMGPSGLPSESRALYHCLIPQDRNSPPASSPLSPRCFCLSCPRAVHIRVPSPEVLWSRRSLP